MADAITQEERAYRAALYEVDGIGPARIQVLLNYFGSAKSVWGASESTLKEIGLPKDAVFELGKRKSRIDPKQHLSALAKIGIRAIVPDDEEYPKLLKEIDNSPQVLFIKGRFLPQDERSLAVVGTRKATPYGRDVTERLVEQLAAQHFTIVSGLARGIDGTAHRAALESGTRTIAVMGGGVDRVYPPEHVGLAQEIAKHGAVVSEFAPGKLPVPGNFPARNRIISGLSLGVLVIEGASQSGTKITASLAAQQGREVFAVPGPITSRQSQAPADLLKLGAKLVTDVSDILDELPDLKDSHSGRKKSVLEANLDALTREERKVVELLSDGNLHIDEIVRQVDLKAPVVSATLTMLEIKGVVKQLGEMVYGRK